MTNPSKNDAMLNKIRDTGFVVGLLCLGAVAFRVALFLISELLNK